MRAAATAAGIAGVAWSFPALAPVVPSVCAALDIPRHRIGHATAVCISFDDGPHSEGTPAVLESLRLEDARATFFLVGEQVERMPALAAEVVAAGHEIALHGHRHRNQLRLTPKAVREDLRRGAAAVAEATGVQPRLYRPPYGIFSTGGLREVRARGYSPLLWSRWGHDWRRRATPASIATEATEDLSAGDVVLLHDSDAYSSRDSWRATVDAVPRVLEEAARRGLATAPVGIS
jgi:peptidoglycan/xylan/chitin deacetylase (PgdA/CDA1 family)